jgi:carbamoyltransferase
MLILGIQYGSHDASAAIIRNGELIALVEQERFNRIKHTLEFPVEAVRYCLSECRVTLTELDFIAYAGDPDAKNPILGGKDDRNSSAFVLDFRGRQDFEDALREQLFRISGNCSLPELISVPHHLCHAASSFFLSSFEESAVFTVDGLGNWVSATGSHAYKNQIESCFKMFHPHSLGFLYGAITQFLGFEAISDESKVMGLAAYGKPTYLETLREVCCYESNSVLLDLSYFTFHQRPAVNSDGSANLWYSDEMQKLFGLPRKKGERISVRDQDLACSLQLLLEERVFQLLQDLYLKSNSTNLCLAGGVALNARLNGRISSQTNFKEIFVVPCSNDAGLSVGAALQCNALHGTEHKRYPLDHCYYGPSYSDKEIEIVLNDHHAEEFDVSYPHNLIDEVSSLLTESAIVGWFQGRMEFGPRALGNRSILANPTNERMKSVISSLVKFREEFEPFASVVLLEHVGQYFETTEELPFMSKVVNVREDKRSVIPAVVHADGTSRVQTVCARQNVQLTSLLEAMKEKNGIPLLLNTSFNVRGETIAHTPSDAINVFLRSGMNALALGGFLLRKQNVVRT